MNFDPSDSSGTDDDLPPTHQNRNIRGGRATANGRTAGISGLPYVRAHSDMEIQIHQLEQEAYGSVLRAFKAQADAITWEKEGLITELRKELRVTDDEHRVLLARVNADDIITRIREWRQANSVQTGYRNNVQPIHDPVPSPTVSASRKKQKTSQSIPSLPSGPTTSHHHQTVAPPMPQSSLAARRGVPQSGLKGKKSKSGQHKRALDDSCLEVAGAGPAEGTSFDPLIGRKVLTRWPADNNFYEAVITDHNPNEGLHALVYDINTKDETWEWVNLKEISHDDIRWEGEDPGLSRKASRGGPARGGKKPSGRGGASQGGRGRGSLKNHSKKVFPPSQNGVGSKDSDDIEILNTDSLIKEVERVFSSSHPDPLEVEKAKQTLKDHEQSLINAIARLADASDGESDGVDGGTTEDRGGTNGAFVAGGGRVPSDYRQPLEGGHEGDIDI